ncbi:MAG: hypothetical protein M1814_001539 [Vezdaea aestivalis]|nr:MAG: hypothetical protein M1814_001539 [Vezdaea aestivalis]
MAEDISTPIHPLRSRDRGDSDKPLSPQSHRPLGRSSTFAESSPLNPDRRRNSILSDYSLDDARNSLRSSTDDLLLPKVHSSDHDRANESTNWHSMPLAFAFFPALGGMFFKNGSAIITDVMLLGLAAVFLNWSVRLPWDWYKSAQSIRLRDTQQNELRTALEEHSVEEEPTEDQKSLSPEATERKRELEASRETASAELQGHEILALISCFLGPLCGAYLLHTIRTQLSRPSEGLVSNYNLTIFLLAAEVRPLSHLVKMVQARTLYLQRNLASNPHSAPVSSPSYLVEISKRIEALEGLPSPLAALATPAPADTTIRSMVTEVRRMTQPDLDALNRAVRRYEKRAQIQTMQTEARLLDLEQRIADSLALAASAAQTQRDRRGVLMVALDGVKKILLLPMQAFVGLINFPAKTLGRLFGLRSTKGKGERNQKGFRGGHGRMAQGSRMSKRG